MKQTSFFPVRQTDPVDIGRMQSQDGASGTSTGLIDSTTRRSALSSLAGFVLFSSGCAEIDMLVGPNITKGTFSSLWRDGPLTSDFSDAENVVVLPDAFIPTNFRPLGKQPRAPNGEYLLGPGAYKATFESYCLRAGTRRPGRGTGYLHAPAKGRRSEIIVDILENAHRHRDIPQNDIQVLLWAILSGTKFSNMPRPAQIAARRFLSAGQVLQLQGGVLGLIPESALPEMMSAVPKELQQIIRAEQRLRQLLNNAETSYAALEAVAVLGEDNVTSDIPKGRWMKYQNGVYIRYFPSGYRRVTVEIYVLAPDESPNKLALTNPLLKTGGQYNGQHTWPVQKRPLSGLMPVKQIYSIGIGGYILVSWSAGTQRLGVSGRESNSAVPLYDWTPEGSGWKTTTYVAGFMVAGPRRFRNLLFTYQVGVPGHIPDEIANTAIDEAGREVGEAYQRELRAMDPAEQLPTATLERTFRDQFTLLLRLRLPGSRVRHINTSEVGR